MIDDILAVVVEVVVDAVKDVMSSGDVPSATPETSANASTVADLAGNASYIVGDAIATLASGGNDSEDKTKHQADEGEVDPQKEE